MELFYRVVINDGYTIKDDCIEHKRKFVFSTDKHIGLKEKYKSVFPITRKMKSGKIQINLYSMLWHNFEVLPATKYICDQFTLPTLKELAADSAADEYYIARLINYHARNRGLKYIIWPEDEDDDSYDYSDYEEEEEDGKLKLDDEEEEDGKLKLDDEEMEIINVYYESHKSKFDISSEPILYRKATGDNLSDSDYSYYEPPTGFKAALKEVKEALTFRPVCYDEDIIKSYFRNMLIYKTGKLNLKNMKE